MFRKIRDQYYSIKNGILNIMRWFSIIWEDRDWDYYYIFALLYHKFNNMEKFFRSDKVWSAKASEVADELKIAKLLCKRIMEDKYTDNALIPVEQKYGELKWHIEPSEYRNFNTIIFDESFEERKARDKAYKHSEYMENQDIEYLMKYIKKNIRKWWD